MRRTYKATPCNALFVLIAWLGLSLAAPVHAQDTAEANKRQLLQFAANNDAFDRAVTENAKALYRKQVEGCQAVDQAVRQLPTPYGTISFPPPSTLKFPYPDNGLWAEHVKIRGCGKVWQINMLAVAQKNDKAPLLLALLPGDTLSDPGSQGSAIRMSATAIRKADATCADDAKPDYTRVLGYKQADGTLGKADAGNGWFEEWQFKFCGKTLPVQIAFIPDGAGGYNIKTRIVGDAASAAPPAKPAAVTQQKPADNETESAPE
jgi:hypothetical protein